MNNPQNRPEKQLTMNGIPLSAVYETEQWWLAVKPLCAALGVNYNRQFQNIKTDHILSGVFAEQQTHDSTGRRQKMICLPERYVYGWLFGLVSESPALEEYKRKCYDVLFDYFHGNSTKRAQLLIKIKVLDAQMFALGELLKSNDDFIALKDRKFQKSELERQLHQLDDEMIDTQLDLFHQKPLLT